MSQAYQNMSGSSMQKANLTKHGNVNTAELTTAACIACSAHEDHHLHGIAGAEITLICSPRLFQDAIEYQPQNGVKACTKLLLKRIAKDLHYPTANRQLSAIQALKGILSSCSQRQPPIEAVIQAGVVPRCVQFMREDQNPKLQYNAAIVLYTLTTTGKEQHIKAVVNAGAVEAFIKLLHSDTICFAEIALRALENIIVGIPILRNFVISKNIIPPLTALVTPATPAPLLKIIARIMTTLCRPAAEPSPPEEIIKLCLPVITKLINMTDMSVLSAACTTLKAVSTLPKEMLEKSAEDIVRAGTVYRLVELLEGVNENMITSCFPAVLNFVGASPLWAQHFIDAGVLRCLAKLLTSTNAGIVGFAAGTVRIIVAQGISQASRVVNAGLVPLLVDVLSTGNLGAQQNAIYALVGSTLGSGDHLTHLFESNGVPAMCSRLKCRDLTAVFTTLAAIKTVLMSAKSFGLFEDAAFEFEECGGLELIEELQNHEKYNIYKMANIIIEQYFLNKTTAPWNCTKLHQSKIVF